MKLLLNEVTRRELLRGASLMVGGALASSVILPAVAAQSAAATSPGTPASAKALPRFAYVGSRTTKERNARGVGITVYSMNPFTGACSLIQTVGDLVNPSFLTLDPQQRNLYCVHGDLSEVSAFSIDPSKGTLTKLNSQSTGGKNPVHLSVDPTGRYLVVANYATGSLAALPIEKDGRLGKLSVLEELPGTPGPHKVEQASSHPHMIPFSPGAEFLLAPDKGLDAIFVYRPETADSQIQLKPVAKVAAREGSGPRHIVFSPGARYAYVVNELDSTVATYQFDAKAGQLAPVQVVSALPETFTGNSRSAAIVMAPDGRFVWVSNRGHDSVTTFAVDEATGFLRPVDSVPSGGKKPRFMTLDPQGRFLYVANEDSDNLLAFAVDRATGKAVPTEEVISTGSPVCMVFKAS